MTLNCNIIMTKKHLKATHIYILLLVSSLFVYSCSDDDPEYLSLTKDSMKIEYTGFNANGNIENFEIGCNTSWTLEADQDWVKLSHSEGTAGRVKVYVTVDENVRGDYRRAATIIARAGSLKREIALIQNWKIFDLNILTPTLLVSKIGTDMEGKRPLSFDFEVNSDWQILDKPNWITFNEISGDKGFDGYISLEMTVEKNETDADRIGVVRIESGGLESVATIKQNSLELDISTSVLKVDRDGLDNSKNAPILKIQSGTAWTLTSDKTWITFSMEEGNGGTFDQNQVTLFFEPNFTEKDREVNVVVSSKDGLSKVLKVTQSTVSRTLPDDDKAIGHIYFQDNFDWCVPFAKGDEVDDRTKGVANMYSFPEMKAAYDAVGYIDINPDQKTTYIAAHYIKMGRTDVQSGVTLPPLGIEKDKSSNLKLDFDMSVVINGSLVPDKTEITVEVEGTGWINQVGVKASESMTHSITGQKQWEAMTVNVLEATSDTRIIIRSTQQGSMKGTFRWYLDNIKVAKVNLD